jgi:hypothetical protein
MNPVIKNWIELPEPVLISLEPEFNPEAILQPLSMPQILPC